MLVGVTIGVLVGVSVGVMVVRIGVVVVGVTITIDGMRERAELLGADLQIQSTVGDGTAVTVIVRELNPDPAQDQ